MDVDPKRPPSSKKRPSPLSAFGQHVRAWRKSRGMTQLDLAISAGSTPRYVSFLETGRSRPRREVVLRLATALDVPVRDRNAMLIAAGLRPEFSSHSFDAEELQPVREVVSALLTRHDPYPGWCWAPGLQVVAANQTAERLFPDLGGLSSEEMVDFWYGSSTVRTLIENWREVLYAGLAVMRREHLQRQDPLSAALLERAQRHLKDVPLPSPTQAFPVVCPVFRFDGKRIRTISTVLRFDTAADATVSDLKVELMFPADEAGSDFFRQLR